MFINQLTSIRLKFSMITCLVIVAMSFVRCTDEALLNTSSTSVPTTTTGTTATTMGTVQSCSTCKFIVPANKYNVDGAALGIKPGDVICFDASQVYGAVPIHFINIVGTETNPVIIKVCGGPVATISVPSTNSYAIKFEKSKYFRLTGGDVDGVYGLKTVGANIGITLDNLTTNFEIDHVEVSNTGFAGIMAKTNPSCDPATWRGNFTLTNAFFHHNFVHDTGGEGFYVGNSFYSNGENTSCGVKLPGELTNIKIFKNHVVNSGWESIQLGCAVKGAEIYDNLVENYGVKNVSGQNNGIQIGEGTGGRCYNNYIKGGYGNGIIVLGLGDNVVYNNVILNAGGHGIFCDDRTTTGYGFNFVNNSIVNPKLDGIRIYADNAQLTNTVYNNLIANPGTANTFVYLLNTAVKCKQANNWTTRATQLASYLQYGSFSPSILLNCPLVDRGMNTSSFGIANDFSGSARPQGLGYDIGAVEYK